ncbi:hypothetical protein [Nonomuraea sp. LPB2021202275-12-8]|uniref:hypothetical protein n=1 Tax=Nonomuraea sp. LPB2021202275-12-8 TaxID=3120159 RepID=UPI00300D03B8
MPDSMPPISFDELFVLLDMQKQRITPQEARDRLQAIDPEFWADLSDMTDEELMGKAEEIG